MAAAEMLSSLFLSLLVFSFALFVFWLGVIRPRQRQDIVFTHQLSRREFRRIFISALMIIVAVLIFFSFTSIETFKQNTTLWAYYVLVIITLLIGIIILAIFDSLESIRNLLLQFAQSRRQTQQRLQIFEDEIRKLQPYHGSNNGKGSIRIDKEV